MNTTQQPMPLEEVKYLAQHFLSNQAFQSLLHHLEAQRKECKCEEMQEMMNREYDQYSFAGVIKDSINGGSFEAGKIAFCPWCGGKVCSTTQP